MDIDASQFAVVGYEVIPQVLREADIDRTLQSLQGLPTGRVGSRCLIELPWCAELGRRIGLDARVRRLSPANAVAVQCTLFVKSPSRNWLVTLHQDLSVPVAERVESAECSGWSEKEGEVFVQPPSQVLEQMLAVRLHLDDCDEQTGALRVVPGSHRLGRLSADEALRARKSSGEVSVPVPRGGVMLMRPLLLHASSRCASDRPRRVLHFVFGPREIPHGLRWRTSLAQDRNALERGGVS